MHKLNSRVRKLEAAHTGEPFVLMLFDDFNVEGFNRQMEACNFSKRQHGKIALFDSVKQHCLGLLKYDPNNISLLEEQLNEIQLIK